MANFYIPSANCVFIHIQKTAGSSIRHSFFSGRYERPPMFGYIKDKYANLFKFAFIRNPYDRLISCYKMFTEGRVDKPHTWNQKSMPLKEFLNVVIDENIIYDERRKTWPERVRHHTIPQTHPFNCLYYADFVGRFENLDEDWKKICKIIGVKHKELRKTNYTNRSHYRDYYDSKTLEIATKYYEKDLDELGYEY